MEVEARCLRICTLCAPTDTVSSENLVCGTSGRLRVKQTCIMQAADVEWTAQELQRKDVNDAKELLEKLQICKRQPPGHKRVLLWRAAVALRAAAQGMEALQAGHLKLASFLNYIIKEVSVGATLQPGDLLQVERFQLEYHKTNAVLKTQSIAQRTSATQVQAPPDLPESHSDLPDVPTHKPEL
jgi:hypothetical protein